MRARLVAAGIILAAAAGGAGLAVYQAYGPSDSATTGVAGAVDTMPDFAFPDLSGRTRQSSEWADKVVVLNFWATWCPPCREEVPAFVDYQQRYGEAGLQFVGVAVDQPDPVRDFADTYGVNYPMLIGETDAVALSNRLGNRFSGLPFTVVFDRKGRVRHRQPGEMTPAMLETHAIPLLGLDPAGG
ncbi:MAG: TlpA disulfide reductase family protein [Chromatiales bacterium]